MSEQEQTVTEEVVDMEKLEQELSDAKSRHAKAESNLNTAIASGDTEKVLESVKTVNQAKCVVAASPSICAVGASVQLIKAFNLNLNMEV